MVAATIASWVFGAEEGVTPNAAASATVLVIAFIKVRLVGMHFMELREAPAALRAMFELWVVASMCALVLTYLVVG